MGRDDRIPVRMLNDRILVKIDAADEERRSSGGILIPATAQLGKRLAWAEVRASGPNVRTVQDGDQVLFNPDDVYEVEVRGEMFIILRERDIHAVATPNGSRKGRPGCYMQGSENRLGPPVRRTPTMSRCPTLPQSRRSRPR